MLRTTGRRFREHLETATCEGVSALEAVESERVPEPEKIREPPGIEMEM